MLKMIKNEKVSCSVFIETSLLKKLIYGTRKFNLTMTMSFKEILILTAII